MKIRVRAWLATAIGAVLAASLAACSGTAATAPAGPAGGATIPLLRAGTAYGTSTLDPLTTQGCAADYCGLFMERLMKFAPDGKRTRPASGSRAPW